ncbi:MAG: hypothetical protein E7647_01685 [Ruminococcaceae bacterium]|nr:hypothetical protein [Oscillospiraceae bacterium]
MKRIIAVVLVILSVALLCSCAKKEPTEIDAIMDYYVERCGKDGMRAEYVKYVGEDTENGRREYHIECEELGLDETLFVEEWGSAMGIYNEEGIRIHIFNATIVEG